MRYLSLIVLGLSLVSTGLAFSQQPQRRGCPCKDCKCTPQSHCGCYSDKGCSCGTRRSGCCSHGDHDGHSNQQ